MTSQLLGNQGGIAAEKDGDRRHAFPSVQLPNLVHLARVEGAVDTGTCAGELGFRVYVLLSCKADVAQQLLDGVIEATTEKDQPLSPVQDFRKIGLPPPMVDSLARCGLQPKPGTRAAHSQYG